MKKVFLTLILIVAVCFTMHAQIDTIIAPGTDFVVPNLPDGSSYTIGIKPNGGIIQMEGSNYISGTMQWETPCGAPTANSITSCGSGYYGLNYNELGGGQFKHLSTYLRYLCDIQNLTPGSPTYGQYPDTVWIPQGGTATLSVGTNFVITRWYKLNETNVLSYSNSIELPVGTYWTLCRDNDSYTSFDTIVVAELIECLPTNETVDTSICNGQSITVGTSTYDQAGTYIDTLINAGGCDSIITTHLTVNAISNEVVDTIVCYGSVYTFPNFSSATIYNDTTHVDYLTSVSGCDSIITTNIGVFIFFTLDLGPDTVEINEGETAFLTATVDDEVSFIWSTGENTLSINVGTTGWYYITATHVICGSATDSVFVDVITNISKATDKEQITVQICPNPVIDRIKILGYTDGYYNYTIYNQTGQVMARGIYNSSSGDINVSIYPEGIYIIKIDTLQGAANPLKFIKQ